MRTKPDVNQIARRVLITATTTTPNPKLSPQQRVTLALKLPTLKPHQHLTPERRAELGRMGALSRWGNATLGIMPKNSSNADMNQVAARILGEATGDLPKTQPPAPKNQAAVELGRLGGAKGGAARKAALSPEQRSEIAKTAAKKRWGN